MGMVAAEVFRSGSAQGSISSSLSYRKGPAGADTGEVPGEGGLQDSLNELGVSPAAQAGQDHEIAAKRIQARQRVDFQEVRDAIANAEIHASHIPTTQHPIGL